MALTGRKREESGKGWFGATVEGGRVAARVIFRLREVGGGGKGDKKEQHGAFSVLEELADGRQRKEECQRGSGRGS